MCVEENVMRCSRYDDANGISVHLNEELLEETFHKEELLEEVK